MEVVQKDACPSQGAATLPFTSAMACRTGAAPPDANGTCLMAQLSTRSEVIPQFPWWWAGQSLLLILVAPARDFGSPARLTWQITLPWPAATNYCPSRTHFAVAATCEFLAICEPSRSSFHRSCSVRHVAGLACVHDRTATETTRATWVAQ